MKKFQINRRSPFQLRCEMLLKLNFDQVQRSKLLLLNYFREIMAGNYKNDYKWVLSYLWSYCWFILCWRIFFRSFLQSMSEYESIQCFQDVLQYSKQYYDTNHLLTMETSRLILSLFSFYVHYFSLIQLALFAND